MNDNNTETGKEALFKYPLSFSISQGLLNENEIKKDGVTLKHEGRVELYKEHMIITAPGLKTLSIPYRDIDKAEGREYKMYLDISGGQHYKFFELGYEYENFMKNFFFLRNEIIIKDLLMKEKILRPYVEGEFEEKDTSGKTVGKESCLIRVYETGVVVVPVSSQIRRYPFGLIDKISSGDYKIVIRMEDGSTLTLSMLGYEFESLTRDITKANDALIEKTRQLIKEISPDENPENILKLSYMLKDGRAARNEKISSISRQFLKEVENKLKGRQVWDYYNYLYTISDPEKICTGIKKGLFQDTTGYYLWFLFPLYGSKTGSFPSTVALEAMTIVMEDKGKEQTMADSKESQAADGQFLQEGNEAEVLKHDDEEEDKDNLSFQTGGKATYVFRMTDRDNLANTCKSGKRISPASFDISGNYDDFIRKVNKCMIAINFRREPVYMTDDQLSLDSNISYRYAVNMIPELSWLRDVFTGRIIHKDKKTWQKDLKEILEFNSNNLDNFLKWQKNRFN